MDGAGTLPAPQIEAQKGMCDHFWEAASSGEKTIINREKDYYGDRRMPVRWTGVGHLLLRKTAWGTADIAEPLGTVSIHSPRSETIAVVKK